MFRTRLPNVYNNRVSQKTTWEQEHAEGIDDVEWLLSTVCQSFGFPLDLRFQFSPDDRLIEIYRSRYPQWKIWRLGDSLELENLVVELEKQWGSCDDDLLLLSLGEIAWRATGKQGQSH